MKGELYLYIQSVGSGISVLVLDVGKDRNNRPYVLRCVN